MEYSIVAPHIRLDDFERFHGKSSLRPPPPVTMRELVYTLLIALFLAPFFFATFFLIPMMGQISVGFAGFLTALYLYYRRSILVAAVTMGAGTIFSGTTFATIQSIKNNLEVPLFILIALGIPVTALYSIFIAGRIWDIRGGAD